jgi:two-component system, sensor histidine kinase and response regulator
MLFKQNSKTDKILAIDDSPDNLFLIENVLKTHGYEVTLAEDGKTALSLIQASPPDLILLDVMMPEMDGYEVTRRIRNNNSLPFIPILLITAHQKSSVVEGLDAGADDFIRKPMDIDELLARVRALLRLKYSIDTQQLMIQQRDDFISRLTHDLRTPLIAVDRMLNLFIQDAFGAVSHEMHEVIIGMIQSNKNLLQMTNTILETYRHDAGHKTLTFSPCDLSVLIQEVIQELSPLVADQRVDLKLDIAEDAQTTLMGDYLELRRMLTNLIGNAIKFTDEGSIITRISTQSPANHGVQPVANTNYVKIEIEDTGSGVPLEDQATLFERFRHGNHKRSGSGLGLYLSRLIAEAHQGSIHVESEVGKGSTFTVYLPVK